MSKNKRSQYLKKVDTGLKLTALELKHSDINKRLNLNFSYLDRKQSQGIDELTEDQLKEIFQKLIEWSSRPAQEWKMEKLTKKSNLLTEYGDFPKKSLLKHPPHVPKDVRWARFRFGNLKRIVGFLYEEAFYVVFIDLDHRFYGI